MWKSNHVAWNHVVGNREMGEETQVLRLIGQTEARSKQQQGNTVKTNKCSSFAQITRPIKGFT